MNSKKSFYGACLIVSMVVVLFAIAWAAEPAKKATKTGVLKIGSSMPLSGPMSPWGIPESEVTSIYADLLNKDGGLTIGDTTYKIEFIVSDDKASPDGIKASADRLINTEKVNAMVGGWMPPIATIMGRDGTTANIPILHMVREAKGIEVVSPKYPVMFDLGWAQIEGIKVYIPKLKAAALPNVKTYALISKDDTLGRTMSEQIKGLKQEWQTKYGLEMVYDDMFPITAQDMTPWLSKIAALPKKADLIFAASATVPNLAMIAKQSYEMGLKVPIVTVPNLTDVDEFLKIAGYEGSQYVYTSGCAPWDSPKTSPKFKEMANRIRKAWKDKYGKDLTFGDSFAWCCNHLAAYVSAVKLANSVKTEDIVRTLESKPIEHFYGTSVASGDKTYGIKRMLTYDASIAKITGREQKPVVTFATVVP
ncbi:MAG TPA: ABC transporter substrate-binding protein [Syntrophorhabdales bacterium]|nr:ABC transporter substrate-binding protein [Syntrophorhabdales bacterium]